MNETWLSLNKHVTKLASEWGNKDAVWVTNKEEKMQLW
jgi:hypothetical protein